MTEESNASDRLAEKGDQETEELKERNKEMVTDLDRRGGGGGWGGVSDAERESREREREREGGGKR